MRITVILIILLTVLSITTIVVKADQNTSQTQLTYTLVNGDNLQAIPIILQDKIESGLLYKDKTYIQINTLRSLNIDKLGLPVEFNWMEVPIDNKKQLEINILWEDLSNYLKIHIIGSKFICDGLVDNRYYYSEKSIEYLINKESYNYIPVEIFRDFMIIEWDSATKTTEIQNRLKVPDGISTDLTENIKSMVNWFDTEHKSIVDIDNLKFILNNFNNNDRQQLSSLLGSTAYEVICKLVNQLDPRTSFELQVSKELTIQERYKIFNKRKTIITHILKQRLEIEQLRQNNISITDQELDKIYNKIIVNKKDMDSLSALDNSINFKEFFNNLTVYKTSNRKEQRQQLLSYYNNLIEFILNQRW